MSGMDMSRELAAMVKVEQALSDLSEEERGRVLAWAGSRYGTPAVAGKASPLIALDKSQDDSEKIDSPTKSLEVNSLAEFYDMASPSSDAEKVLVVGYWLQFKEGYQELESHKINKELKHLGHGVGNVTRALDWNKAQKPAFIVQKRKEGTTKQARKKFVVTNEGKKFVEKMLRDT